MKKQVITMVDVPRTRTEIIPVKVGEDANGPIFEDQEQVVASWTERQQQTELVDMTPEEIVAFEAEHAPDLAAYAARRRWQKEISGCVVGGHQCLTDRESQAKFLGALTAMAAGLRTDPSAWKFADGFVVISNADLQAVCLGVLAHVQGAYDTEREVQDEITAGTITTTAEVDAAFA